MDKVVVGRFTRNQNESIVVSRGSYKDKVYVDMRVYFKSEVEGEFTPTKKGLTIQIELVPQLVGLLNKVMIQQVMEMGHNGR